MTRRFIDGELVTTLPGGHREEPPGLHEMGCQLLVAPEKWDGITDRDAFDLESAKQLEQCLLDAGCLPDWIFIEEWVADKAEDYRPVVPPFGIQSWQLNAWGLSPKGVA